MKFLNCSSLNFTLKFPPSQAHPKLTHFPSGTSSNRHILNMLISQFFAIENMSHPTAGTAGFKDW